MTTTGRFSAILALLLCALALAAPAGAQRRGQTHVTAKLTSGVVKLGGGVSLVITVVNARSAEVGELPRVDGLRIGELGPPSTSRQMRIVNGVSSYTESSEWRVAIRPDRAGDFEIPPIQLRGDGREVLTRALPLTVVEDLRGETLGFFELVTSSSSVYEGQPLEVELRFGWDLSIDPGIGRCNLSLPWWGELPGVLELEGATDPRARLVTIDLNRSDTIAVEQLAPVKRGQREYRCFRLRRRFMPTRSGGLEFPTSFMAFVQVIQRGRGGFFAREPDVTETYYVPAEAFEIEVLPLPEEDRPFDFTGAVGSFEVRASVDRRDVDAGDSIKLKVEWSGVGNFEFFEAPDLARMEHFRGFRVYGSTESKSADGREVVYDIAPISPDLSEIPPVPLSLFDTETESYSVLETRPIPIRVRALENASGLGAAEGLRGAYERDIRDIESRPPPGARAARPGVAGVIGALLAVPVLWLGFRRIARRKGDPDAPVERRRRKAARALRRELASAATASEQLAAAQRFLAARTREKPEAWLGRDTLEWARAHPEDGAIEPEGLRPVADLLARLEERAFGGDDGAMEPAALLRELKGAPL